MTASSLILRDNWGLQGLGKEKDPFLALGTIGGSHASGLAPMSTPQQALSSHSKKGLL